MSGGYPEKIETGSMSIVEDRIAKLREDFPEVFREGKIDFDALKRSLGEWVDPGKERFGLNWPGKANCMRVIQQPSTGTLVPMREESVDFDTTQNLIIEGDNLEVLKLLQKSYYGKVKMIYIDPPYNTGNEFIYPDDFKEGLQGYLRYSEQVDSSGTKISTNTEYEGRYHSNWLNMMYSRLFVGRNLLTDDGLMFVSVDDHEVQNLRSLLNEVFGEENFVEELIWKKSYGGGAKERFVVRQHEYCLLYAKNIDLVDSMWLPPSEEAERRYYKYTDEHLAKKGPFRVKPLEATKSMDARPNLVFPITAPDGTQVWPKRQWWWSIDRVRKVQSENGLHFARTDEGWSVSYKQYLIKEDGEKRGAKPFSIVDNYYTQHGTDDLRKLFNDEVVIQFPKPVNFIKHLIRIAANDELDLILDFFAGSGTSAQAVAEVSEEDGIHRRFILVQLPEPTGRQDFHTISAITRERVRRAGKAIARGRAGKLDLDGAGPVDLGFRAYRLTSSNFTPWDGDPGKMESVARQLSVFADNLVEGRSGEDILTEILLLSGYELTVPVERLALAGAEVFSVDGGAMLVCLERALTLDAIEAMIARDPSQIVCLDAGFNDNDELKVNAGQRIAARARSRNVTMEFKVI